MSDEEKINIPPWIAPSDVEPVPDSGAAPLSEKPKRKRRTKAEMLAAREAGMVSVPPVPSSIVGLADEMQVPITIDSLRPAAVPSLSPEAKARIIPQPTRITLMFMKWCMLGVWLGYRNVSFAFPLLCIKVSW